MLRLTGVLLALALPSAALAWGGEGHRVVATLAYERLTPQARQTVDRLIAAAPQEGTPACAVGSVQDAATWPDCVRGAYRARFAALIPRHFEDRPLCGTATKAQFCKDGACVSEEVKRALGVLRDRRRSVVDRLIALEEVEHFVGDMHQPLHMTDNGDRGGNAVQASLPGGMTANLHHVWDTELVVDALGSDETRAEATLRPLVQANAASWARSNVNAWAAETHLVGVAVAYGRLPRPPPCGGSAPFEALGQDYVDATVPVVRQQLGRAAVRLAVVLNAALG